MDTWRTDDMALAAYLMVSLRVEPDLKWEMESCFFEFEETDDLLDAVQDFVSGDARIEPRTFNMVFGKLKKAVFNHPSAPQSPLWRRQSRTA